jgi:uncharacterized repeat protein (TIGR01451 family)
VTVTVPLPEQDSNPANNTASDTDTITLPTGNLLVTKDDGRTNVLRGTSGVTYTVVVTNNGPDAITGTVTDTLPGGARFTVTSWTCAASAGSTCTAGGFGNTTRTGTVSLLNGGVATYTLRGNVPVGAPTGPSTNTVAITNPSINLVGTTSASDTDAILAPTLSSISPTSGLHNTAVPVTLSGSNLAGATGVTMSGGGVTCTLAAPAPTDTTVHANCSISNGAAHSVRNVTVATAANGSATLNGAFTVQ